MRAECTRSDAPTTLASCRSYCLLPACAAAITPRHIVAPRASARSYSPQQLYDVVASVQHYASFVPWCVGSHVLSQNTDGTYLEAELQIGFQMISERCAGVGACA